MNSLLNLGRCLGDVSCHAFQRQYQNRVVQSLDHQDTISFSYLKQHPDRDGPEHADVLAVQNPSVATTPISNAHQAGTNCLALDPQTSRYLITGGADSTIRLWDLESRPENDSPRNPHTFYPAGTLSRANPTAHTHALISLSIYPFDPGPQTILSTAYDKTLLLTSITPTSLEPLHKINLDFTPYTHAVSPHPSSSPLVAIGTSHPAIRLVDLRSGLSTHSLPGHNGAIYALQFSPSPRYPHLLISGSADGRILLFDIRRANPAFASLDLDDAVGYSLSNHASPSESRPSHLHLNYAAQAHNGPVTGLSFIPSSSGDKLISAGHDSRLRVWDLPTGRNELVHFGPRIRNTRNGNLAPLILPSTVANKPTRELLLWPNDDEKTPRGEIFLHSVREGTLLQVLKTKGVDRSNTTKKGDPTRQSQITRKGRINALALRQNGESGGAVEVYAAHGDGSVSLWSERNIPGLDDEVEVDDSNDNDTQNLQRSDDRGSRLTVHNDDNDDSDEETDDRKPQKSKQNLLVINNKEKEEEEKRERERMNKKRKRDLIGDLVQGLTKKKPASGGGPTGGGGGGSGGGSGMMFL